MNQIVGDTDSIHVLCVDSQFDRVTPYRELVPRLGQVVPLDRNFSRFFQLRLTMFFLRESPNFIHSSLSVKFENSIIYGFHTQYLSLGELFPFNEPVAHFLHVEIVIYFVPQQLEYLLQFQRHYLP